MEITRRSTGSFITAKPTGRVQTCKGMSGPAFRANQIREVQKAIIRAYAAGTDAEKRKHVREADKRIRLVETMDKLWKNNTQREAERRCING